MSIHIPKGTSVDRLRKMKSKINPMKLDSSKIDALNQEANAHIRNICGKIRNSIIKNRLQDKNRADV